MYVTEERLSTYRQHLADEEAAPATISRYMGIVEKFLWWMRDRELTKENLIEWRQELMLSPSTVNVHIAAVNKLLSFLGLDKLRLRQVKTQKTIYRAEKKELGRQEYERLIRTAEKQSRFRLARAIETICSLGIRVSELRFVTVQTLDTGTVTIKNKGKIRTILLHAELVRKLKAYCKECGLCKGVIFVTRSGNALGRKQLWKEMKEICGAAGVDPEKVFPHNLRHLFAVTHYSIHRDLSRLADLLGHTNVNTTRIYLKTSGAEQRRELEMMGLILSAPLLLHAHKKRTECTFCP